jgi:hypothetical protein
MTRLTLDTGQVFVDVSRAVTFMDRLCLVTIRAVYLHIDQILGFQIRAATYLVILRCMAIHTLHAHSHVNVAILRWNDAMLVVWSTAGAGMAPQAHLVRWPLYVPCYFEHIHSGRGPKLERFTIFHHLAPVIRGMTDQTIDVLIIRFGDLFWQAWLGTDRRVTYTAATWLRRF